MNERQEPQNDPAESVNKGGNRRTRRGPIVAVAAVFAIAAVAFVLWLYIPRGRGGKPVPAPRSVGPDQASNQVGGAAAESTLTISPEQAQRVGIKIEIVGEQVSTQATGQQTTGIVQPNSYRETPVMSLVGGILRTIGPELGQNVHKGQTIAVVSSSELADAQTKYLAASAELDEHHQHHARTEKLVAIGAASR